MGRLWATIRSWWPPRNADDTLSHLGVVAPQDAQDLIEAAATISLDYAATSPHVIAQDLRRLRARGVPIRRVAAKPAVHGVAELHFADGTSVMIRGRHPGDLGRIAVCALQGHLWLEDCEADPHGVTLRLRTPNGSHDVVALWVEHPE